MKKEIGLLLSIILLFMSNYSYAQKDSETAHIINKYSKMSPKELIDKGDNLLSNNVNDSAIIFYSLIYNSITLPKDTLSQQIRCMALNRASNIYYLNCDYKMSLEMLLKALEACEEINYKRYIGRVYNNIGNVYYQFNDYNSARKYYNLAYQNVYDAVLSSVVLNNLGLLFYSERKYDSALLLHNKACRIIRKDMKDTVYNETLNSIGLTHQALRNYDSALFYFRMALNDARKFGVEPRYAMVLSNIGQLYLQNKNLDSAGYYLKKSNEIAYRIKVFNLLYVNYQSFSEIEEMKGNLKAALEYYKKYSSIKDSILNNSEYGKVSELESSYKMGKIDKQIKELNVEQEIKERRIVGQRRLQAVMIFALMIVVIALLVLYRKNKTLDKAYSILVEKNREIIQNDKQNYQSKLKYEERLKEKDLIIEKMRKELEMFDMSVNEPTNSKSEKTHSSISTSSSSGGNMIGDDHRRELELAILEIMNDRNVFCDPDFSLSKLSEMVDTNFTYISWIINHSFNKNFSTFINEYRIKEACRMLSESDYKKYSIETIATMVGFKSKGSFNPIFKEITGVTPSVYIRSIKLQ